MNCNRHYVTYFPCGKYCYREGFVYELANSNPAPWHCPVSVMEVRNTVETAWRKNTAVG